MLIDEKSSIVENRGVAALGAVQAGEDAGRQPSREPEFHMGQVKFKSYIRHPRGGVGAL